MKSFPKPKTVRSKSFLMFVRTLDCAHCGAPAPSEPSHYGGKKHGGGVGLKGSDLCVAPLCSRCHRGWHQFGGLPARACLELSFRNTLEADESHALHIEYNRDALAKYVESLEAF